MEILGLIEKIINIDKLDKMISMSFASIISLLFYFKIADSIIGVVFVFIFIWGICNCVIKVGIGYYKLKKTYDSFSNDELIILMEFINQKLLKLETNYFNDHEVRSDGTEKFTSYNYSMFDTLLAKNVLIGNEGKYVINRKVYDYIKKKSLKNKIIVKEIYIFTFEKSDEKEEINLTNVEYNTIYEEFVQIDSTATTIDNYSHYYIFKSLMHKGYLKEDISDNGDYYLIRQDVYDYVLNDYVSKLTSEKQTNVDSESDNELPF